MPNDQDLRQRLRKALVTAMKERDTAVAVPALRSALAAIDNAEAVVSGSAEARNQAIGAIPVGAGATEAARRVLTEDDVVAIVRADVAEREAAALDYDRANQPDRARLLRAQAQVLSGHLPD